jgi:hypothetical protein
VSRSLSLTPYLPLHRALPDTEATRYIRHIIATVQDTGVGIPRPADRKWYPQLAIGEGLAKVAVQPAHQRVAERRPCYHDL